jgi:hypothetical protein
MYRYLALRISHQISRKLNTMKNSSFLFKNQPPINLTQRIPKSSKKGSFKYHSTLIFHDESSSIGKLHTKGTYIKYISNLSLGKVTSPIFSLLSPLLKSVRNLTINPNFDNLGKNGDTKFLLKKCLTLKCLTLLAPHKNCRILRYAQKLETLRLKLNDRKATLNMPTLTYCFRRMPLLIDLKLSLPNLSLLPMS